MSEARLGGIGVWAATDGLGAADAAAFARRVEELGYSALWVPEVAGRDPFTHLAYLATATTDLRFATGIASIHHRVPGVMLQCANTLAEQTDGRFLLGLGVSHAPFVEGMRGLDYSKPLTQMRRYLEGMDASPYMAKAPAAPAPRLLAALGPKMLELAAEMADGAHPYWTTPEHTAKARATLGPDKLLCVEQKVVVTDSKEAAHAAASDALAIYATLPNYRNNWLRLGYTDEEIDGREPRFLDAVVAWGSVDAVRARLREHVDAGADHVCIQPLIPGGGFGTDLPGLEALAPGS